MGVSRPGPFCRREALYGDSHLSCHGCRHQAHEHASFRDRTFARRRERPCRVARKFFVCCSGRFCRRMRIGRCLAEWKRRGICRFARVGNPACRRRDLRIAPGAGICERGIFRRAQIGGIPSGNRANPRSVRARNGCIHAARARKKPSVYLRGSLFVGWNGENPRVPYLSEIRRAFAPRAARCGARRNRPHGRTDARMIAIRALTLAFFVSLP